MTYIGMQHRAFVKVRLTIPMQAILVSALLATINPTILAGERPLPPSPVHDIQQEDSPAERQLAAKEERRKRPLECLQVENTKNLGVTSQVATFPERYKNTTIDVSFGKSLKAM